MIAQIFKKSIRHLKILLPKNMQNPYSGTTLQNVVT